MKRPAAMYAVLPLLVALAVSFLFQVSDCSRPSPEEPRAIPRSVPVLLRDDDEPEPHVQLHHRDNADDGGTGSIRPAGLETEGAVEKAIRAAADDSAAGPPSAATTTTAPARDDMVGRRQVGSGSREWGGARSDDDDDDDEAAAFRTAAARVLAGVPPVVEGAADSAAKSSCHSSDVHISCPPSRN